MKEVLEPLDRTLMALADPTRRSILRRLARGPARVTEVAGPFNISLNSVSKHIRVLERARLVRRRKAGREHILSLDTAPMDEAAAWLEKYRALWNSRLDALGALLREEDRKTAEERRRVTPKRRAARSGGPGRKDAV